MSDDEYDCLKLENQVCFPLYVCSKGIVRRYAPFLEPLGLTYTQYITMMVLWEYGEMTVKELGMKLHLDSGTLTPLLKKMEEKGYIVRERNSTDERSVIIRTTEEGDLLKERAKSVPSSMRSCIDMDPEEALVLQKLLQKIIMSLDE